MKALSSVSNVVGASTSGIFGLLVGLLCGGMVRGWWHGDTSAFWINLPVLGALLFVMAIAYGANSAFLNPSEPDLPEPPASRKALVDGLNRFAEALSGLGFWPGAFGIGAAIGALVAIIFGASSIIWIFSWI